MGSPGPPEYPEGVPNLPRPLKKRGYTSKKLGYTPQTAELRVLDPPEHNASGLELIKDQNPKFKVGVLGGKESPPQGEFNDIPHSLIRDTKSQRGAGEQLHPRVSWRVALKG